VISAIITFFVISAVLDVSFAVNLCMGLNYSIFYIYTGRNKDIRHGFFIFGSTYISIVEARPCLQARL